MDTMCNDILTTFCNKKIFNYYKMSYWLNLTGTSKSPVKKTRKSLEKQTIDTKETVSKFKKNIKQNVHPNNKLESKELKLNKKKFK
jgi:hypothetical protein